MRLDHSNWVKHIPRHPEVEPYHDRIAEVLTDPDIVVESPDSRHYHFYRLGIGGGRFRNVYLHVIVMYMEDGSRGKVKTVYFTSTPDVRGTLHRMRRP